METLKLGSKLKGFILKEEEFVNDINSNVQIFEHEKTGAKLIYIANDDKNKTFTIGFKTPPEDSTGVMHILEHSVLCGSKNFPVKEPFVELCKGSLNTFLNAMTYGDKTVYPVASTNEKDFLNLMNVYLDAVFYPNIYNTDKILKQEGWHYHIENESDEITYNGVVYNEMKGVYSSPINYLFRKIDETLYPDTPYGHDSGGDPKYIPNLTYEQFVNTHKKFYHPSNSYIALYGDLDLEKSLSMIDEKYLSNFDRELIDAEIQKQEAFLERKDYSIKYSVLDESQLKNADYIALNMAVDTIENTELSLALNILKVILLHSEESPLRQAILDAGLGDDAFGIYYAEVLQPYFSIIIKGANKSDKNKAVNVIEKTLSKLVKEGINKDLIEGCINMFEFICREGDSGSTPKGINYSLTSIGSWIHGANPIKKLKFEKDFSSIRKALTEPYFENIIEEHILNNNHSSLIVLEAELNISKKEEENLKKTLSDFKKGLSEYEINNLIKDTKELLAYQSRSDREEDLKKIPILSTKDIERKVNELNVDKYNIDGINVYHYDTFTSGIAYITAIFDVRAVDQEDISYIGLLSDLIARTGTKDKNHIELSNEIMRNTGGLGFNTKEYSVKDNYKEFIPTMTISCKALTNKLSKAVELIIEVIKDASFEDDKKIKEIIKEAISDIEINMMSSGHSIAISRMSSYYQPSAKYKQKVSGLEYYNFLKEIDLNIDNKIDEIKAKLYEVKSLIFNSNNMQISIIGSDKEKDSTIALTERIKGSIDNNDVTKNNYVFTYNKLNEGLLIPSEVQYVAKGYNFEGLGHKYDASIEVLENVLRYGYLWNKIRVKGGAYGAFINISENGMFNLCSYRDPNIKETINTYDELANFVENIELSERELEKAIIGTISNIQLPTTPQRIGKVAIDCAITEKTKADRQNKRDKILNTTTKDLRKHASLIKDVMNQDCQVVVGNEKIKECKELFGEIYSILK